MVDLNMLINLHSHMENLRFGKNSRFKIEQLNTDVEANTIWMGANSPWGETGSYPLITSSSLKKSYTEKQAD